MKSEIKTIAFPHPPGAGGPGSFQKRFESQLLNHGWTISYAKDGNTPDVVFIVGGSIKLLWLLKIKLKKVPIIFRLDGISWLHQKVKVGLKNYITAVMSNWAKKAIHAFLANKIIYQSNFVKRWWEEESWRKRKNVYVIYNGIEFNPNASKPSENASQRERRLVILEGVVDYTPYAVRLLNDLAEKLPEEVRILIYGKFDRQENIKRLDPKIEYMGFISAEEVAEVLEGAVYLSLDINPACPNTVIEALASSAPVVAFETGALPELIDETCGYLVPYGSDPWQLKYPDVENLVKAIQKGFLNYSQLSKGACKRAKSTFDIHTMYSGYNKVFKDLLVEKL